MSLQIRRGTNADRLTIVPEPGELLYITDTNALYVGNGIIPGGILVANGDSIYGNAQVQAFLAVNTGNISGNNITATGNINSAKNIGALTLSVAMTATLGSIRSDDYRFANGTPISLINTYGNANVADYLPTYTGNLSSGNIFTGNATATGNLTAVNLVGDNIYSANYYFANGSPLTTYTNANVASYLDGNFSGNIIPQGNNTQSLGNTTNRFKDLWLSGNTIYLGGFPLSIANSVLTFDGLPVVTESLLGDVVVPGNLTVNGLSDFQSNVNVSGVVFASELISNANVTGTVITPFQPYITTLGHLTGLNVDGISANTLGVSGNTSIGGDLYVAGNVNIPGNINVITGNSGSFFGNAVTGFGALYAGIPTGYTLLDNEVMQLSANYDGYAQITFRNINSGSESTGDFVVTADNGNDTTNYVNLGIASSAFDGVVAGNNNALGTALFPNDSYLYSQGNASSGTGGNLVLGARMLNKRIHFIAGGGNLGDIVVSISPQANAANASTGTLQILGGIGATGDSHFDGNIVAKYFAGNIQSNSVVVDGNINVNNIVANTVVGNIAGATGLANVAYTGNYSNLIGSPTNVSFFTNDANYITTATANVISVNGQTGVVSLVIPTATSNLINDSGFITTANANVISVNGQSGVVTVPIYTDANVANYLPTYSGNLGAANLNVGNIFAGQEFVGNLFVTGNASFDQTLVGNNVFLTGNLLTTGNITGNYIIGNGSQLTGLPAGYANSNVFSYLGSNSNVVITTTGNITGSYLFGNGSQITGLPAGYANSNAFSYLGSNSNVVILSTGNITTAANISGNYILGNGAFLTGMYANSNVASFLAAFGSNTVVTTGNITAGNFIGNGSQLTAVNAVTVDVTNTNGLTTTYYPTFVENRTTGQIARADVDLTYRTDTNTLGAGNIIATANITANTFIGNIAVTGNIQGTSANVELVSGVSVWSFNNTGNLVLPGNTFAVNYANGVAVTLGGNYSNSNVVSLLSAYGSNSITTTGNITAGNLIGNISVTNNVTGISDNVTLIAGNSAWVFNNSGNLVLPANTFAVNYANGVAVTLGGNYGNANVADFLDSLGSNAIVTTGNITGGNLIGTIATANQPGITSVGNLSSLTVTGNITANNLGNISALNLNGSNSQVLYGNGVFANVSTGVTLPLANGNSNFNIAAVDGNATITANVANTWIFGTDGVLTLADGNSTIQSIASSSQDPLNPNVSTMVLTPDSNYNSQILILDPTAPGHLHIRTNTFGNIDEPTANLFLGGELSSFEVGYYTGTAPNVFVHSGGNTWTFANDGLLTLPSGSTQIGTILGADVIFANNAPFGVATQGNGTTFLNWSDDISNTTSLSAIYLNGPFGNTGDIIIRTGNSLTPNIWNFGANGEFSAPSDILVTGNVSGNYILGNGGQLDLTNVDSGYVYLNGENSGLVVDSGATDRRIGLMKYSGQEGALVHNNSVPLRIGRVTQANILQGNSSTFTSEIYITGNGLVGINTTTPTSELTVNGNITANNLGNISALNLTGSNTNVLYGNGVFAPASGGGSSYSDANVFTYLGSNSNVVITTTGNITTTANISGSYILGNGSLITGVVTATGIQTLTNKRIDPRVLSSTANSPTPTLNTDNYDMMIITGQSVAITSFTTNLTGTPVDGQKLWISITGTTAIAITWGSAFASSTVTLPTTTVSTTRLDVGFVWDIATSKWLCVASTAPISGTSSYGDSNVVTLLSSFGSNTISTTGNVSTGNILASGTSSTVVRRAFGLVAYDTTVTLDDLSVSVPSSGINQDKAFLQTSGSWQGVGFSTTYTGGASVQSWINIPLNTGFGIGGTMASQGNGIKITMSDQTPTAKMYEITIIRSGTTGAQWNISIQRLV